MARLPSTSGWYMENVTCVLSFCWCLVRGSCLCYVGADRPLCALPDGAPQLAWAGMVEWDFPVAPVTRRKHRSSAAGNSSSPFPTDSGVWWLIPLRWQPALLPDFWGSATAPVLTVSALASATLMHLAYHRPASHTSQPISTLESNSPTLRVWGFSPLYWNHCLSSMVTTDPRLPPQVVSYDHLTDLMNFGQICGSGNWNRK